MRVQDAHEPLARDECGRHAFEDVREPETFGRGVDEDRPVVGDDAPLDGDLDLLTASGEPPAGDAASRPAQRDAVVRLRSRGRDGFP